ncbi:hypothetical protein [Nocardia sp. NPDC051570]|uniref:hypothetical protein n=1 Tax=Nocardia sp. NPDC051570 TaxID=3364324 RepID=UPI0037BA1DB1
MRGLALTTGRRNELAVLPPDEQRPRVLDGFEVAGGNRPVYIGEPRGEGTGGDAFVDRPDAAWRLESEDPHHVSWWNPDDAAQAWIRR